jgi:hypothetical protein
MRVAIIKAIHASGGGKMLVRELAQHHAKISRQAIYGWRAAGLVPAKWCVLVEAISGVPRSQLNEIIYPPRRIVKRRTKAQMQALRAAAAEAVEQAAAAAAAAIAPENLR